MEVRQVREEVCGRGGLEGAQQDVRAEAVHVRLRECVHKVRGFLPLKTEHHQQTSLEGLGLSPGEDAFAFCFAICLCRRFLCLQVCSVLREHNLNHVLLAEVKALQLAVLSEVYFVVFASSFSCSFVLRS